MDAQHHRMGVCLPRGLGAAAPAEPGFARSPHTGGPRAYPPPTAGLWVGGTPPCTTLGAGPEVQPPPSRSPRTELNTAPHLQAPAGPARSHLRPMGSGGSFCCSYVHSVYSEKANSPRNQTQRCPPSARHRLQAAGIEPAARWRPVSAGRDLVLGLLTCLLALENRGKKRTWRRHPDAMHGGHQWDDRE